ncbi:class I SAM-dependent methyltransferase [Hoyosella subflava]|uniref:Methyltransferase type 11 n=1 Tax=Hoyosella subflava (strain DSM 45089 / JCM 17490 / NBRC 109087 / DQS3-9A1) TaxID=443218 RepID=F6ELR7_HOYSD|nr:class I SAM-dependent methyltransferase [Hoyosella subflava]AEF41515.1 Methyltransferase type 11 [Hoyosella subflava DQS3-9A1]
MAFEELKRKQSVMWGTGPYERLPEHYAPLLEHLATAAAPRPGEHVLDVATGTGALATRLARTGAKVTGIDLAPALIETAKRLAKEDGLSIDFEVGDAENLPYADGTFDLVVSNVGAIFAPDHKAVAKELARVTRPGGRLGLGNWSPESGVVDMFKVMAKYMPPPPAGAGSAFTWGDREYVEEMLGDAFDLTFETGDAPQKGSSGEEVWELFATVYGPTRTLAANLEPERRAQLRQDFADFFEGYRTAEGIHQPRPYLIVLGTRR